MRRTIFQPLKEFKTTKGKERFEDDHEEPMSPKSRSFHEPGYNVYIVAVIGMKNQIDVEVLKANAVPLFNKNRRFSCLQVKDKESGSMKWVPTHVNTDNHVIVPELDPDMESSDKFVEDYISNLSRSRIENSRPLWDLHILNTKTSDAQGTCVFRFHHSLGDGISLMTLLLSFCRKASDLEAHPTFPRGKVSDGHNKVTTFRSIFMIIWNSIVAIVMFFLTLLFLKDTETPLKGSLGAEDRPRRFVKTSVSLDDIKMVKKAMDVTVNDLIVGVLQASLYRYLQRRYGAEEKDSCVPKNIRLRALIPFNMRATSLINAKPGELGNKIGSVLLPLNIKRRDDPLDYVRDSQKVMESKKASLEPLLKMYISNIFVKLFGFKIAGKLNLKVYNSITLIFSNLPGPQEEISLFGNEISYLAPTCYGLPVALLIHVVSYVDKLTFVVSVDEETIPDPQQLCDDLQQSFHLIKTSALANFQKEA